MVITVDGYDGTGKSTLAENIKKRYGFEHIEKPFIKMWQDLYGYSEEEIVAFEGQLWKKGDKRDLVRFYLEGILWMQEYGKTHNVVLDRGVLTTYAVLGNEDTADVFDEYIARGAFHEASIYLVASDLERRRRIYENDPNDPDLRYPIEWRKNDLIEYADSRKLNYFKVDTNGRGPDQVFEAAIPILDKIIYKEKGGPESGHERPEE